MKWLSALLIVTSGFCTSLYAQTDHQTLIDYTVDKVMTGVFKDFSGKSSQLRHLVHKKCSGDLKLDRRPVKLQWEKTFLSWMRVELFALGPVKNQNRDFKIYFWPVRKSKLLPVINNKLSAGDLKEYSIAGRGLAGIEYILYESSLQLTDQEICQYLIPVSTRLSLDANELLEEWQGERGFAELMKQPGRDNKQFLATQDVINLLIGKIIQHSGSILKTKLGLPIGKTAEKAKPFKVEARRSGLALKSLLAALDTYEELLAPVAWQAFSDKDSPWLKNALSTQRGLVRLTKREIEQIKMPLDQLVKRRHDAAYSLYENFEYIDENWKAVAQMLNVSAGFNDNDGD